LPLDVQDEKILDIITKIGDTAKHMNDELFLFDIDWKESTKPKNVMISAYDGEEKGFWSKHQNVNWISNGNQRKLCATVVLNDSPEYEGGDYMLYFGGTKDQPKPTEMRAKGTLLIYPAFRFVQIMPVLSGMKYNLDLHWEGPYWR
jgi:predicted 2-oxoglutarate/Fe(II)-dependent dioxygenase YbiX